MTKEIYTPSTRQDNRTLIERTARNNATAIERALKETSDRGIVYEPQDSLVAMGSKQSDTRGGVMLKLRYSNGTANNKIIFLGTPLGDATESAWVPQVLNTIPAVNRWTGDLADQFDNQGANLTYLQLINKRLLRHPSIITSIEIVTSSDAQREISPSKVFVPWNNPNSRQEVMEYMPIYTEVTGQQLLSSEPVICGEFSGLSYEVLAGVTVNMNIYIASTDCPTFKLG